MDRNGEDALPMFREDMARRGWDELDVLLISGDAYVDHPSFGVALLGRWLQAHGFRVGIVAQPRWTGTEDFVRMGRPRLFAGVTAGAIDSLLAHYTAFRKKRSDDAYTPGGRAGARPNRATIVYTNLVRQAFPGLPVVIGGIEASLRRAVHYDFWTDKVRPSILLDSKADLLVYGMGERAILEIAQRLHTAQDAELCTAGLRGIPGTAFAISSAETLKQLANAPSDAEVVALPSYEAIQSDSTKLMEATLAIERQVHQGVRWAVQASGNRQVVLTPPAEPMSTEELDALYALPFTRRPHPSYTQPIPAAQMIQFSVTSHRGCAGGCTFCSIALHQGREIQSRSADSLKQEVQTLTAHPDWAGSISDVGGPTANMWGARCAGGPANCKRADCLTPTVCRYFETREDELVDLLRTLKAVPGVKHLRVASGVRYDLASENTEYVKALVREFVGGQLKIAPEHRSDHVLRLMRKPKFEVFEQFLCAFDEQSQRAHKEQYVVPYLISAFPGCTDDDMRALAEWLRERGWKPQQVQCFIPTPGTVATAMYFAGIDPKGKPIPVARTDKDRMRQHYMLAPKSECAWEETSRAPSGKRRAR
ncbi:MAG: YgiQ family radical SAM protein [Candidatus Hydrogenedentes bacterium]|nr:YgiQ family radical SAM protein [Candidatus Hydrogenedentota bacterium]